MQRKRVTMKDVAQEMNVSVVSVSKALAGKDGVSEALRERIIDTARSMGYVLKDDTKKREIASQNIAIIVAEWFIADNSFYLKIYQNLIMELSARGYIGILEIVRREDEDAGNLPNVVRMELIEQVIVIGELKNSFLDKLMQTGLGIIFFDFENEDYDVDCVVGDNVNGGYLLARCLVRNGYEKIGFVGNCKNTRNILDRYMGYLKYMIANDLYVDPSWTILDKEERGDFIELKLPEDMPEAFICNCDVTAYRLIDTLRKKGYAVPQDVAVVGYDDYAEQVPEGVELTTYRVRTDEMIRQCIHIVEQRVKNRKYRRGTSIVYGELVCRKTVMEGAK